MTDGTHDEFFIKNHVEIVRDTKHVLKPYAVGVQMYGPNTCAARCTCGWVGPERQWAAEADEDAEAHALDTDVHLEETT